MKKLLLIISALALISCAGSSKTSNTPKWQTEYVESIKQNVPYEFYAIEFKETNEANVYAIVIYYYYGGTKKVECNFVKVENGKVVYSY